MDGLAVARSRRRDARIHHLLDRGFPFVVHGRTDEARLYAYVTSTASRRSGAPRVGCWPSATRGSPLINLPQELMAGLHRLAGYRAALTAAGRTDEAGLPPRARNGHRTDREGSTFVISWNEVFAASILTFRHRTLTAFLLTGLGEAPLHFRFAGGFFLIVPSLIFIFAVRKYLFSMWGIANR